jgi:hypothetical protein
MRASSLVRPWFRMLQTHKLDTWFCCDHAGHGYMCEKRRDALESVPECTSQTNSSSPNDGNLLVFTNSMILDGRQQRRLERGGCFCHCEKGPRWRGEGTGRKTTNTTNKDLDYHARAHMMDNRFIQTCECKKSLESLAWSPVTNS